MEYTIDGVLDYIVHEFDLSELFLIRPQDEERFKKYIQNLMSKKDIPYVRQEHDKQGKPKIYNQESIDRLLEFGGRYFASFSAISDEEKRVALENYSKYKNISYELDNMERLSDDEMKEIFQNCGTAPTDEELELQNQRVDYNITFDSLYKERKYQIMLEALFNDKFEMNEENLRIDIQNKAKHLVYDAHDHKTIRSLSRIDYAENYYKKK
ncbi:hypothetical protein FJO98_01585 [Enterococcus sp. PF-2]|uniref:hypothetical protein n=1 Tax=unclassified Enterococcus TaxID=2608891 RepID=UPI0011228A51|nr:MULTISPECIES: hypothetical protein [unclassified Enterococcus]TPE08387.1 hypothetical protein FJP08_01585 [Enterococcus sp. PF-3]TPE29478.1 hypothetical protein FJO98_01585 [Enterococcus sp. PF-2]